jgi:hypothetical protein
MHAPIRMPAASAPRLIVVIDTEEEFDWNAPVDRSETRVSAMDQVGRVQDIFDQYGIKPCYVIDYPVASQEAGNRELKKIFADGRCEIGAHLHPWVTPPFEEPLCPRNTFPGNLERPLELRKLSVLTETIAQQFGQRPTVYKAGRYGVGPNTTSVLHELGYEIDLSLCPPVDFRAAQGPDFSGCHAEPFWFGPELRMLEIPVTGAFVGWAGAMSRPLYNFGQRLKKFKVPGVLARLSAVDRLMLSPEGFDSRDHLKITRDLYRKGVRTFTWSFHSPSVLPGCTDYVRNDQELRRFLDSFRCFFDFFFGQLGGEASSPTQLRDQLRSL